MVQEEFSGAVWSFEDGSLEWEQHEHEDGATGFFLKKINSQSLDSAQLLPYDFLVSTKSHVASDCPYCDSVFPSEFSYCPHCGTNLIDSSSIEADMWLPPYGTGNGLKLYKGKVTVATEMAGKNFDLPPFPGLYAFCSVMLGCRKRPLLAVNRSNGSFWVFNTAHEKWLQLQGNIGKSDSIPVWSWAVATNKTESGICIPCDSAPVWVRIDWLTNRISLIKAEAQSCGGIIELDGHLLAPVLRPDGSLALAVMTEGETTWSYANSLSDDIDVARYLGNELGKEAYAGIPVKVDGVSIVYWPCRGGCIQASISSSGVVEWSFSPWETDQYPAIALVDLGSPHQEGGSSTALWQLCRDYDPGRRDTTVYKVFRLGGNPDGYEGIDWKPVEQGQILSTGKACFSTTLNFWKNREETDRNATEHEDLRIPLLEFVNAGQVLLCKVDSWREREILDTFTDIFKKKNARTNIGFFLDGSGRATCPLRAEQVSGGSDENGSKFFYEVSRVPQISVFMYERELYIYLPEIRQCFRWSLLMEAE